MGKAVLKWWALMEMELSRKKIVSLVDNQNGTCKVWLEKEMKYWRRVALLTTKEEVEEVLDMFKKA